MSHRRQTSVTSTLGAAVFAALLAACSSSPTTNEAPTAAATPDAGSAATVAADPVDDTAAAPPTLGDLASTVCLSNGTTRDPNATTCTTNSDCKQSPYTDNSDWDKGRWKKQCDAYSWMTGVSIDPSENAQQYRCEMRPDLTTTVGGWVNEGFTSTFRSATSDWDPGYTKAECPLGQYMSGYSVNTSGGGEGSVGNIRCVNTASEGNNTSCHGVTFAHYPPQGNAGYIEGSDDWAPGAYKLECAEGEHMAGMSTTASSGGRIHGILCCGGGPPPSTSPTGAASCCNSTVFPASVTSCTTNPTANAAACNLVDYCCQTGISTYAGTAACNEVAYAQDPSTTTEGGSGITVGPASSTAPTAANGTYTLFDEYAKVRGNYGFGAGYDATVSLSAAKSTLHSTGKTELKGYAVLFGKNVTLADLEADADSVSPTIDANLTVVGVNLYNYAQSGVTVYQFDKSYTYTFFNQSKTFTVGPVPVTVAGSVAGTLGLGGQIGFSGHTISLGAGPYLDVTATASAALGGSFGPFKLEAGVEGSLTLFNAQINNTVSATPGASSVAYNASSALQLTEISGNIDLYVDGTLNLVFAKYHKKWTYGIVSFTAAQQNVSFANYNGTLAY